MRQRFVAIFLAVALVCCPMGAPFAYGANSSGSSSSHASKSSGVTLNSSDDNSSGATDGATGTADNGAASTSSDATTSQTPKKDIKVPPAYDPDAWDAASLDPRDPDYPYSVESTKRAESGDTYSIKYAPMKPSLTKIRMGFYDVPQDAVDIPNSSLLIAGTTIPYVDWRTHDDAPEHNGGLWEGAESPIDGHWGYYIGHNPGDFTPVTRLSKGDQVYVRDSNGRLGCYTVTKITSVDYGAILGDLRYDIEPLGEAIVLQTCINGGAQLMVVIAEAARPYVYQT